MSDNTPDLPDPDDLPEPFRALFGEGGPPDLEALLGQLGEQLGGDGGGLQHLLSSLMGGGAVGPVDWDLARRMAIQQAAEGDRGPTTEETARAEQAFQLAEHWLDETSLPAPSSPGAVVIGRRTEWVEAALTSMRPLVEPVVAASTRALVDLMSAEMPKGDALPPELAMLGNIDISQFMRPFAASIAGMQIGQILGTLAQQLLGQYDLGVATAPRASAYFLPVNIAEAFEGWDLDPTEVAVVLALHESAHRRLFHAVPWLEAHLHGLIAQFANGTEVDPEQLRRLAEGAMGDIDPEDPAAMQQAMERLGNFRLDPTPSQQRVLDRIQGIVTLVQGWATHEVALVAAARLPGHDRVMEVVRRRRAVHGDGEAQLARLLGLDLTPSDAELGERFVRDVAASIGPDALREALAHPENLPDVEELADPARWSRRVSGAEDSDVPDDLSGLFEMADDAPVEPSWEERAAGDDDQDSDEAPPA